jgi:spermidine synthase
MDLMILASMARRLVFALILSAILTPAVSGQEDQVIYEVRSQFQLITVRDTANGYRQLIFDGRFDGTDAIQSEMNLANHEELMLSYARHIMTALPVASGMGRILIVGLGGACMQRYLYKLLPGATIETAELDPEVRSVAAKYFFFKEDGRQIVHLGDGRTFLENSKAKYDIIFLDAFSALSIPYRLATQEFLNVVRDHLAEGGIACANLWDGEADYHNMVKTYAAVFPEVHVVKCAYSGNSILLALPRQVDLTVKTWMTMAEAFDKQYPTGLDLAQLIARGAAEPLSVPETARVLHDK